MKVILSLFHDNPTSEPDYLVFEREQVLDRMTALDRLAKEKGFGALNSKTDKLIPICMETTAGGRVTANGIGAFSLAWELRRRPGWPSTIMAELNDIRAGIKESHGARLRFLIWAAAGVPAEEIGMYSDVGLLKRSPLCYVLDSTDPAKLKCILDDMVHRSGLRLADALRSTLVVAMATEPTASQPLMALERLAALFAKNRVDSRANFRYFAPPGSPLDKFGAGHGYSRVAAGADLADEAPDNSHCAPLTRGSLYPLGLAKVDLETWVEGADLDAGQIDSAWRLAAFLNAQALAGRGRITLVLPKPWSGVGAWTKYIFAESAAGPKDLGTRIVLENKIKLANYRSPREPEQDRTFLAIKIRGLPKEVPDKIGMLRRSGYPLATVTIPKAAPLSAYMQFIQYTVFGIAYLRGIRAAARRVAEDAGDSVAQALLEDAERAGGTEKGKAWREMVTSPHRARHRGLVNLYYDGPNTGIQPDVMDAPTVFATIVKNILAERNVECAEMIYFGDTRYCARGRAVLKVLQRSAERLFRSRLKLAVDVCEGPPAGPPPSGKCLAVLLLNEKAERLPAADFNARHHQALFLAARLDLAKRGRNVVAVTIKDLDEGTIGALEDFFRQATAALRGVKLSKA